MGARHSMELYLDRPSSDTGLRRRELKALSRCWVVIERDLRDQSIKLFVRLMRKHPEYRRYFGTLAANSPPVLTHIAADARVQSHFRTILTSVGSLVYNAVSNPDNLVPKYDFLALVHRHLGLTLQDFFNFRDELIDYFKTEFPSQMTPLCVGAWHTLLTRAFTEIFRRIDEFHRTSRRHHHHHHHKHKHKHRSSQERPGTSGSFVGSKSMGSMFECTGETLYWEHRKPFWKTQLELWGEAEDDDWLEDEDDDDDVVADDVLDEPDPNETRRQRARRRWRRLLKKIKRYLRKRRVSRTQLNS